MYVFNTFFFSKKIKVIYKNFMYYIILISCICENALGIILICKLELEDICYYLLLSCLNFFDYRFICEIFEKCVFEFFFRLFLLE